MLFLDLRGKKASMDHLWSKAQGFFFYYEILILGNLPKTDFCVIMKNAANIDRDFTFFFLKISFIARVLCEYDLFIR